MAAGAVIIVRPRHAGHAWAIGIEQYAAVTVATADADDQTLRSALQGAECVFVDGAAGVPGLARRIHAIDSTLQGVAVTDDAQRTALSRALLFAPGIGEIWIASPDSVNAELVERASDVTRRRRRFGRTNIHIAGDTAHRNAAVAEERAIVSEAFLAGLLGALPDPVVTSDESGQVISANAIGDALLAHGRGSESARNIWSWLTAAFEEGVTWPFHTEGSFDATGVRSDGSPGNWHVHVAPIRAGAIQAWAFVARDVTDQIHTQRMLEDLSMELETQAAELQRRQIELSERAKIAEAARVTAERARAEADSANAAKSQFLAMMSHELRTPLNAIIGYSQLLELEVKGPLNTEQHAYLERLRTGGEHLLGLISDILDLSKIDAGGMIVTSRNTSVGEVVDAAKSLVAPAALARGIEVLMETPDSSPMFSGDADRTRQILVNLLSNAVKFTAPGGRITILSRTTNERGSGPQHGGDGPWAVIEVTDTGIGIAPEMQTRVFEPFVQAESGQTRSVGGTGLGLAISRRLARLMGGDLSLSSVPSQGSTFTLSLPAPATTGSATEDAVTRTARALRGESLNPQAGLRELGLRLRSELGSILESLVARMRADVNLVNMRDLPQHDLENHTLALLANIAQALIVADQTGDPESSSAKDGVEISRVVAQRHGVQRRRLGWTATQVAREYALLTDEFLGRLRQYRGGSLDDIALAKGLLQRLIDLSRTASTAAFDKPPASS